jgi:large subunit ribosomal protein L10
MSKKIKTLIQQELKTRFENVQDCLVISMRGLKGVDNNQLRGDLLGKKIHICVVKNSLAGRAFGELGMGAMKEILTGPCAIAYGGDSIIDLAKALVEWSKKLDPLEIKGGYLEGNVLDSAATVNLSRMPNRQEMNSIVIGQVLWPGGKVAGAIVSPAGKVAGCVKALIEKLTAEAA